MQFDYTITDADVGRVLTPANGFLINLSRTSATPPGYEIVEWDEGRQQVKAGRLVLRASGDVRDLVCIDTQSGGGWGQHARSEIVLANRSIRFRGNLLLIAVPKGSQWSVSISGVPVVRRPAPNMGTAFATGSNYIPRVPPAPREAVLIER
jgi:hypothetical protein